MKEYQKLLYEDVKRQETEKAKRLIKLGLFNQKQEESFDTSEYNLMTYGKKFRGLYDLYQHKETMEMVFVCPLVEDNKGDQEAERKDLTPYAYDCLYLEVLDAEEYDLVLKASSHEGTGLIDIFYFMSFILYLLLVIITIITSIALAVTNTGLTSILLVCGPLFACVVTSTILLPILFIQYRKFKAE